MARTAALLGAAASLALPATAGAAQTYVVDPAAGGTACSGTTCPTIGSAVGAAANGDTIEIREGTYPESPTIGKTLVVRGAGPGKVTITGAGSGDVVKLTAEGIELSGLSVEVPQGGGSAVVVEGAAAKLSELVATRANPSSSSDAVLDVTGSAEVVKAFVTQGAGSDAPAIASTGTGGLVLTDSIALSSTGPGLLLTASEANRVVRSTLATTKAGADGVRLAAATSAAAKKLALDSAMLVGGAQAAALAVVTSGSTAGDVTVDGDHVTAFGGKGVLLDARDARGMRGVPPLTQDDPAGNITATFTASLVHGAAEAQEHAGALVPPSAANEVKLTFERSDTPPATGNGTIDMGGASNTEPGRLFAPNSLNLRADAPVIDKGGPVAEGASATDIHGEPRQQGAATDIGADEFHNKAPTARFGVANPEAGENEDVGFISGSTDPEQDAGGGIVEYRWDFGDGTTKTTSDLAVAHRYARAGTYKATLQVVDRQGGVSAVTEPQTVTIKDRTAPVVQIAVPVEGQKVKLTRKRKPPLPLTVLGSWADPSGVDSVQVALRVVKRDKVKKKKAKKGKAAQASTCEFYSGRHLVRGKSCDQPIWVDTVLTPTGFVVTTHKKAKLPRGRYELKVRGRDKAGNVTRSFSADDKTLVRFRIR